MRRRAHPDPDVAGGQVGGEGRGTWYYRNLALQIVNYAQGAHEGLPRDRFNAACSEGSDADERRLFYIAMTRARDADARPALA